jgi:hypothetical protein
MTTEWGKPFTRAGFGSWFGDRSDDGGLPHCGAHGLRKARATILAERSVASTNRNGGIWPESETGATNLAGAAMRLPRENKKRKPTKVPYQKRLDILDTWEAFVGSDGR